MSVWFSSGYGKSAVGLLCCVAVVFWCERLRGDVQLGDQNVPRDRMIVYLFIGHSNMDGKAKERDNPPHERVWRYSPGSGTWSDVKDDGSILLPLLSRLADAYGDYHFGAIKMSVSAATVQARYRRDGGTLYEPLMTAARKVKEQATLGGVVALIGFAESGDRSRAEGFLDNLKGMIQEMREDLSEPDLPLLIGKYEEGARDLRPYKDVVLKAIYDAPKVIPRTVVIDKDGPYCDGHHYTAEGFRIWSDECVRLIQSQKLFPTVPAVTVGLTSPAHNEHFAAGRDIVLSAKPASKDGRITSVGFFDRDRRIGQASGEPWQFTWRGVASGVHRIQAQAADSAGKTARSSTVTVAVGELKSALMVSGPAGMGAGDCAVRQRLEDMGMLVRVIGPDEVTRKDAADAALAVILPGCHALGVRKFAKLPVPVVIFNNFCPELLVVDPSGGGIAPARDSVALAGTGGPLSGGLSGSVKVFDCPLPMRWSRPNPNGIVGATVAGEAKMACLYAYETGSELPRLALRAPNRRVSMFMPETGCSHLTADGWKLFDASVRWALSGKSLPRSELPESERYDSWPASMKDLVFLWEDASAPNRLEDPSLKSSRQCRVAPHGGATFGRNFEMDTRDGWFSPQDIDDALLEACRRSNQLTVEMTLTPAGALLKSPPSCRVLTFSSGPTSCNFAISTDRGQLTFVLRSGSSDARGARGVMGKLVPDRPTHVVLTCGNGAVRCFMNGRESNRPYVFCDSFANWEKQHLIFGDEQGGGANWRGLIEGVAIYSRVMDADEIEQRCGFYSRRFKDRKAPERIEVMGKLVRASRPTDPPDVYNRCLIVNQYEVEQVMLGECRAKRIQVAHWATLDGKHVAGVVSRKVGQSYRLVLEDFACHKELQAEERVNENEALDEPLYCDVAR